MKTMRKTKAETDRTIKLILTIARRHFTEQGYAAVSLESIVKEAELTRGVIYHHFKNKEGLFLAVFEEIQKDIGHYVEQEAMKSNNPWEQLMLGCRAFISAASEVRNHRILLIDGPAVLGWDTFREMDQKYSMNSLGEQLQLMKEQNIIDTVSIEALTHCLSGAMNESALWIAENPDRGQCIHEVMITLETFLKGYKN